ncbi:MAG: NERD domain-containing protein [Muribaculaceae bacterium]|nr:NERD domain-containing protein [Muribaculaceae bacterium]
MAQFIPPIEKIEQFKVQPTEGEWALLHFLEHTLDDSFEVYFNPFLNGDRPDVVLMRKGGGVMIIEVKDWDIESYTLDEKKHWHLANPRNEAERRAYIKSPIDQADQYKKNLYNLHIENLLEMNIKNSNMWAVVVSGVYFHNATHEQLYDKLIKPYSSEKGYMKFMRHVALIGSNDLEKDNFECLLKRFHIISRYPSNLFTDDLYNSICHLLLPPLHTRNQGQYIARYDGRLKKKESTLQMYSEKQDKLIFDKEKRLEWRVKGVVGSGKTTVLAAKAVQAYKELRQRGIDKPKILILFYNITLKNYIHDKLNQVHEDFDWASFTILNYHQFINAQLNNLGIVFQKKEEESDEEFGLFDKHSECTERFDVIFIDEIQDYKRVWMDIIKDFFRHKEQQYPRGGYYLLGDVKQNIYNMRTEGKDVVTNIRGVNTLDTCLRSDLKIKDLAIGFQRKFFDGKYEIDETLTSKQDDVLFGERDLKQGYLNYMFLQSDDPIKSVFNIIEGNIQNRINNVAINDITVLGAEFSFLQLFETYYRYKTGRRTTTMFETYELMFFQGIRENSEISPTQLKKCLLELIGRDKNKKSERGERQLASLFTIYEMYRRFPDTFTTRLDAKCREYKTNIVDFIRIMELYENNYEIFRNKVFSANYKFIRENKKYNFWMNTGNIKISSIHSFKGWESDTVFLILQKHFSGNPTFNELLYTGITRTRSNLIVINLGNEEYHEKMKHLIETYK